MLCECPKHRKKVTLAAIALSIVGERRTFRTATVLTEIIHRLCENDAISKLQRCQPRKGKPITMTGDLQYVSQSTLWQLMFLPSITACVFSKFVKVMRSKEVANTKRLFLRFRKKILVSSFCT